MSLELGLETFESSSLTRLVGRVAVMPKAQAQTQGAVVPFQNHRLNIFPGRCLTEATYSWSEAKDRNQSQGPLSTLSDRIQPSA